MQKKPLCYGDQYTLLEDTNMQPNYLRSVVFKAPLLTNKAQDTQFKEENTVPEQVQRFQNLLDLDDQH